VHQTIKINILRVFIFFLVFFSSAVLGHAQEFKAQFKIDDAVQSSIYLVERFGASLKFIDSTAVNNGMAFFTLKNRQAGLYAVQYLYQNGNKEMVDDVLKADIDFLYWGENIHLQIKHENQLAQIDVIESAENKLWYDFKKKEKLKREVVKQIFESKTAFENDAKLTKALKKKINQENENQKKYLQLIQKKTRESIAAKMIFHSSTAIPLFEFEADELEVFYAKELIERCNFNDTALLYTNIYENLVFNYIISQYEIYQSYQEQEAAIINAIKKIMQKAALNTKIKTQLLVFIHQGMDQLSATKAKAYLEENYPITDRCADEDALFITTDEIKTGEIIPENIFHALGLENLSFSKNKNLIIFWTSWCPYSEQLRKNLIDTQIAESWQVYIINLGKNTCNEDQNLFPAQFKIICDGKGWNSELAESMGIVAVPFMIVTDKNGQVVALPENLSDLELKSN